MASGYPTTLDNFNNPGAGDAMNNPTTPHALQHSDANDAIEALQAKVGVNGSAVASSLDYRLSNLLLGSTIYNPATATSVTVATTMTALDTTNLIVTFTPLTTRVMVQMTARQYHSTTGYTQWALMTTGAVEVPGSRMGVTYGAFMVRPFYSALITGLTPGTPLTWRWAARTSVATSTFYFGEAGAAADPGPASMYVYNF